jgi:Fe-S-cluster containining protein
MCLSEDELVSLELMNDDALKTSEIARHFNRETPSCEVCWAIRDKDFVIPGKTRWTCTRCGGCCTGLKGTLALTGPMVAINNVCVWFDKKVKGCRFQEQKWPVCKVWPFWAILDEKTHPEPLLVISRLCPGFGKGPIITQAIYDRLLKAVMAGEQTNDPAIWRD